LKRAGSGIVPLFVAVIRARSRRDLFVEHYYVAFFFVRDSQPLAYFLGVSFSTRVFILFLPEKG
jgi:hypothetical protein